jgi:hypothetical protein
LIGEAEVVERLFGSAAVNLGFGALLIETDRLARAMVDNTVEGTRVIAELGQRFLNAADEGSL